MNPDSWQRIQLLFEKALAQPDEARSAFIESACGDDVELRDEVLSLVAVRLRRRNQQSHELSDPVRELPTRWLSALAGARPASFIAGERVAGRYLVQRLLGRGGMGEVYEAWDEDLAISVALKTLHLIGTEEALHRLKNESLLARSVSHPNVCRVYDLSRHGEGKATVWFLAMELLRGETLAERLRTEKKIPLDRAFHFAEQMAAALGAAHQAGVVHRDLKPGNVMLVSQGAAEHAVVMDFGIARDDSRSALLVDPEGRAGAILGTPAYMAPEQVQGKPFGPPADIYALGIVLHEMVTGTLPFTARSAHQLIHHRLTEDPPSPRTIVPELDERWEAVILRCLARDPKRRFARADEVIQALTGQEVEVGGDQNIATLPRFALPAERHTFVGRESEIHELERQLTGRAHVVTLLGTAGMGKTRLAVRYGWQSLGQWPGGVWFCDLTDARSLDGFASGVAGALGVQLGRGDPVDQLGNTIEGRGRCLMILDNVEQVLDLAAMTVSRWMQQANEARFVVTSRERLNLGHGEQVHRLEPLSPEQGMELFATRARWLRPGLKLEGAEADAAREVVRLLDGIPLAIELAAARMRVMSATQLMAQMRKRFQLLTGGPGVRHETLAAAIDDSWEMLRGWEKAAWTQCAVFEGGFTLGAAEAVVNLDPWPEKPWVVDVIQSLVDKSLLRTWTTKAGPPGAGMPELRFGMYVSLQEYARQKLRHGEGVDGWSAPETERIAEERHGKWYAQYGMDEAIDALDAEGGVLRRRQLEQELENLIAACRRAMKRGDARTSVATYRASWAVLDLRGPFSSALDVGLQVLADPQLGPEAQAKTLITLAQAEMRLGHSDEASVHFKAGLAIHREMGNRRLEGVALGNLAQLHSQQGQMTEAVTEYEAALAIARESGDRRFEGHLLANLGSLYAGRGWMEAAESALEAALAIHREMGDRRFEGMALGNLGALRKDQGRIEEARVYLEAALRIHREVGHRRFEGTVLNCLGGLHFDHGRMEEAHSCFEAAITIARGMGSKELEGSAIAYLGLVLSARGQLEEARAHYEAALVLHRQVNNRRFEGTTLTLLADTLLQQGRIAEARDALVQGEVIFRQTEDRTELGQLLCSRGELELRSGDLVAARNSLAEAEALAPQTGSGPHSLLGRSVAKLREMLDVNAPR